MIKIGYFIQSDVKASETFIHDLIVDLNQIKNIDLTVVYAGNNNFSIPDIKSINVNFLVSGLKKRYLNLISRIFPGFSMNYELSHAKKNLDIKLKEHFDIIYVEYASTAVILSDYLTNLRIPFIIHTHGYDITSKFRDPKYADIFFQLHKKSLKIITPSKHLKRYLIVKGFDQNKIEVVYPFEIKNNHLFEQRKTKFQISFLGRLTEKKSPLALIEAFSIVQKKFPDLILNVMGDGDLIGQTKKRVEMLNLTKNVVFHGLVKRDYAFQILNESILYVQHSVNSLFGDQEGFPVSIAEACSLGLPIISTIHSGISESVIDGYNGFLVQEYDYMTMASKIEFLLNNPKIVDEMSINSRKQISKVCGTNRSERIYRLVNSNFDTN